MNEKHKKILERIFKSIVCLICLAAMVPLLLSVALAEAGAVQAPLAEEILLTEQFDTYMAKAIATAIEGARALPKRFWIAEGAPTPVRDDAKYGTADSAAELQWLLDEAKPLLDGQETLFNTAIEIREGSQITYYLDETIFAICWQQIFNRIVYTVSEVKIADPSQMRRYVTPGGYPEAYQYTTQELSAQIGAVACISGDYYRGRANGIVVRDGKLERFTGERSMDSCFVDAQGNLDMIRRGTLMTKEAAEAYIAENDIQFSLAFGPCLIKDGVVCSIYENYPVGENFDRFPRCAICQKDKLHYLLVTATGDERNQNYPNLIMFTDQINKFGVQQAYTLDGGKTGAIVLADEMMNPFDYGDQQRRVGDMIFFATAIPNKKS